MKVFLALTLFLALTVPAHQPEKLLPDQWQGLLLDQATPEDVQKLLGPPFSQRVDAVRLPCLRQWLTPLLRTNVFRILGYRNIGRGVERVSFTFHNNKLAIVVLTPQQPLLPKALEKHYGIPFVPFWGTQDDPQSPQDFASFIGRPPLKSVPPVYDLVGVTPRSFVCAAVFQEEFSATGSAKPSQPSSSAPIIILFSRTLEKDRQQPQ